MNHVPDARVYEPDFANGLSEENRHYLEKVLRLRPGDEFFLTDGRGREASARLGTAQGFQLGVVSEPGRDPRLRVTLYAALTKGDRFEWLLEKAVELGVWRMVPLISDHSIIRELSSAKRERYTKIALSAMLQSGGCRLPIVDEPVELKKLPRSAQQTCAWVLHERVAQSTAGLPTIGDATGEIWIASGPEGGFAEAEVAGLLDKGWVGLSLGSRRLRAETAPLAALAALFLGRR